VFCVGFGRYGSLANTRRYLGRFMSVSTHCARKEAFEVELSDNCKEGSLTSCYTCWPGCSMFDYTNCMC
jgi:hypothetical protein